MEIIFTDLYKKHFQEDLHMAASNTKNAIENALVKKVLQNEELKINLFLSNLINGRFYLLIITEEKNNKILVYEAYKILKEFVEDDLLDPYIILRKFVWQFGLTIEVGDQLTKFIDKEEILLPNASSGSQKMMRWINRQKHTFVGGVNVKRVHENEKHLLKLFMAYYIDIDRYKSWIGGNLEQELAESAAILKNKLLLCPLGQEGWQEYENVCVEIIEYLFRDSFKEFDFEKQTSNGLERRDLTVVNNVKEGISFWADIKREFGSKHIIFEFKNLTGEVGQDEVNQAGNYTNKALGKFAIIFSRKGLSSSGEATIKKRYREDSVLVLNCTDEDLIMMLEKRCKNEEPEDILRNKKSSFERSY